MRRFRGLPIGSRNVTIAFRVPRIKCRDCNAVRQTPIGFADPRRTYTRSFARYVLGLARMMTIRDVALHLGVSWDLVKEIVKNDLQRRFWQAQTPTPSADRHRRDFHRERPSLPDCCPGPGNGSSGPRGTGERRRRLAGFLETLASLRREDRGHRHRHVARVYRRRDDPSSQRHAGFRPLSRDEALQRQAFGPAAGTVPSCQGSDWRKTYSRELAGCC